MASGHRALASGQPQAADQSIKASSPWGRCSHQLGVWGCKLECNKERPCLHQELELNSLQAAPLQACAAHAKPNLLYAVLVAAASWQALPAHHVDHASPPGGRACPAGICPPLNSRCLQHTHACGPQVRTAVAAAFIAGHPAQRRPQAATPGGSSYGCRIMQQVLHPMERLLTVHCVTSHCEALCLHEHHLAYTHAADEQWCGAHHSATGTEWAVQWAKVALESRVQPACMTCTGFQNCSTVPELQCSTDCCCVLKVNQPGPPDTATDARDRCGTHQLYWMCDVTL